MSSVLLAYPAPFLSFAKFKRKLDSILRNLADFELICASDPNGFIERYCTEKSAPIEFRIVTPQLIFREMTHATIFNDGDSLASLVQEIKSSGVPVREIATPLTRVVNKDKDEKYDVYIGRGTPWGNPYAVGFGNGPDEVQDDRYEAIRKFRYDFDKDYLRGGKEFKKEILQLSGKRLGCHCKPLACHGDVLADYLNALDDGK